MASKKKLLTSAIALGTAAALTLGGTFAWQSINQTALNEASDVINPGGRLHDDFDGSNKDIYVENFTDPENGGQDIFARIRLEEYFEIIMNYGKEGAEKSVILLGSKEENTDEATKDAQPYTYTYETYKFDGNKNEDGTFKAAVKDGTSWWNWSVGSENSGEKYYMPTFNLNKDSLVADTNGDYVDAVGGISNRDGTQYENYVEYAAGDEKTDTEIYDGDSNDVDEVGTDFENLANYAANIVTVENKTHEAKLLEDTTALISMEEYLALGRDTGNYWVYDTDGWVYWANPIKPGETTGRLLDGIALSGVMDDTWYYAINVVAQFVTANDVGKLDGTGFYDTENGTVPSENAETLLRNIGVEIGDTTTGDDSGDSGDSDDSDDGSDDDYTGEIHELTLAGNTSSDSAVAITDTSSNKIKLRTYSGELLSGGIKLYCGELNTELSEKTDYTYDESTGILTILLQDGDRRLNETGTRLIVASPTDGIQGDIIWDDDGELTLTEDIVDGTVAPINTGVKIYDEEGQPVTTLKRVAWMNSTSSPLVEGTDYTLKDSTVTILNEKYAGCAIVISGKSETMVQPEAILYVAPAAKEDEDEEPAMQMLQLSSDSVNVVAVASQESFTVTGTDGETLSTDDLTVTAVQNGESKTLALDTDYTYSNGTLTITNSDLSNAYVCVSDNAGNKGYVHAAKGEDAYFLLHTGSNHYYEAACAPVNTAVRVETQSYGTPVETEEKKFEVKTADGLGEVTLTSGTDYQYNSENKTTLTITNAAYAGRVLLVTFDGQGGYIFVTAAE